MSSENEKYDRLATEVLYREFIRKAKELQKDGVAIFEEESDLIEKFMIELSPSIIKMNIAILDTELTSVGKLRILKTIIRMLIETITPADVYGMFSTIEFELQEDMRKSMSTPIIMAINRSMEKSEKDGKNILAE